MGQRSLWREREQELLISGIELLPDDDDDKRHEHGIQNRQPRVNVAGNVMMRLEPQVRHAGPH